MTIQQTIERVQDSAGSLFTREDVISLLTGIETGTDTDTIGHMKRLLELAQNVKACIGDLKEPDESWIEYELSIDSYNTIQLECLEVDTSTAKDSADLVIDYINSVLNK